MSDSLVISGAIELLGGGVSSTNPRCLGAQFRLQSGFDIGAAQPTTDYVATLLLDGERPFGRRSSNRTITLPILIQAPNRYLLAGAREVLESAVDQDFWTLTWTQDPAPGSTLLPLVFDCFRAQPTALTYDTRIEKQVNIGLLTVTFQALPYGRSDVQTQVSFASPLPATPPPPPTPVVLDNYSTINSLQTTQSTQCIVGPNTAWWDPMNAPANDPQGLNTPLVYGASFTSPLNLSQMTSLGFWFGLGSRYYYNLEHRGRSKLSFYFTLTDTLGHTLSFSRENVHVPASPNATAPVFTRIVATIPQNSTSFNYASVASYSLTVVNRARPNRLSWTTAYLDALTAYPSSQTVNTVVRGAVYTLFGVAGTARAPMSLQFQQPASAGSPTTITNPGSSTYTVPGGTVWLKVECWGGGGAGASETGSGVGGGGGGGAYSREDVFAAAPAQVIPYTVGPGGIPFGATVGQYSTAAIGADTRTTSWSVNPQPGSKVLVVIAGHSGETYTSVIDNGVAPSTFVLDASFSNGTELIQIYRADDITLPNAGSYAVTLTASGGHTNMLQGASYLGVASGAPTATNHSSATSGSVTTGSVTPARAGALFIGGFSTASSSAAESITFTGTGTNHVITNNGSANQHTSAWADKIDSGGPTSTAETWTLGDAPVWAAAIAVYDAATGPVNGSLTIFGPGPSSTVTVQAPGGTSAAQNSSTGGAGGVISANSISFPGGAGRTTVTGTVGGGGGGSAGPSSAGNSPVGTAPVLLTTPGSSTWLAPAGVTSVFVECWGSGGSGAAANGVNGGGGGGGEYVAATVAVTPGNNYSYTVAAGGAAVTGSQVNGNNGAATTFTGDNGTVTANGGARGLAQNSNAGGAGGSGGGFSGGSSTEFPGGTGGSSNPYSGSGGSSAGTAAAGNTGSGYGTATAAPSGGGAGGAGSGNAHANGVAGTQPGGGGGGTYEGGFTTGAGAAGQIRISQSGGGGFPTNTGATAVSGGGGGGNGGGSANTPGSAGAAPGGGGGGADSTGTAEQGGLGAAGQITITPYTPAAFKTLIVHRPPFGAPKMFWPMVGVGNGGDVPNGGTQYTMPQPVTGVQARFGGTYTVYLINSSWNNPTAARTITITVTQLEVVSGTSWTSTVQTTVTPTGGVVNGIVNVGVITLPQKLIAPDNTSGYFTVSVTDTNTADRFLDCLFLDTQGQTAIINEPSNGYITYYIDEPDPNVDMPRFLGTQNGRPQAISVADQLIWSGGPFSIEPAEADNLLFAYSADAAAPNISASYFPRWYFGRLN